jgi:hypothetical protein
MSRKDRNFCNFAQEKPAEKPAIEQSVQEPICVEGFLRLSPAAGFRTQYDCAWFAWRRLAGRRGASYDEVSSA